MDVLFSKLPSCLGSILFLKVKVSKKNQILRAKFILVLCKPRGFFLRDSSRSCFLLSCPGSAIAIEASPPPPPSALNTYILCSDNDRRPRCLRETS